ncbi:HlyD family efflux transporter periplasmic adaptor subunit [Aliiglaciecola sp. M165]|nr:HlyD family efflux transporter periplasmic adaptor subunit [Aliiglaciecola sp. M165]
MDMPIETTSKSLFKKKYRFAYILAGLIAIAFISASYFDPAVPSVKQTDVWISEVKQGEFTRKVRGVGVLAPSEIRWIAAASAGRVERLLIKPGALVSRDTVIAELSNPDILSQYEQAQWELDAAEANLLALAAQLEEQTLEQELMVTQSRMFLETAKLKQKAEQPLADKHIISDLDFATTQLNTKQRQAELDIRLKTQKRRADVVSAKLAAEEAKVRKFRNMLNRFESQLNALKITADIDGVLQQISVDVGQRVEVGGNIARVARPDSLMAELQIQENLVQDLQLGFVATIDTRNGLVEGVVKRIDPRVQNGNVQVDVELTGQLPNGARPDLSVTGTIIVEQIENALYIDRPAGAVALTDTRLFTLDSDQRLAQQRKIKLGKASVSSIQIIAGLQQGDSVIVSDMSEFTQHDAIRLTQ